MQFMARAAIFSLAVTAVLSLNGVTTSTRRRHRYLAGPPYVRQAAGSGTGHTQLYCHNETQPPVYFTSQPDNGGPGLYILNGDPVQHGAVNGTMYFLYENDHDFVPYLYTVIPPGGAVFVVPCSTFEGRVVRGDVTNFDGETHLLGTWAELNWNANGTAWGDVSLLQGNDGPVILEAMDGGSSSNIKWKGFNVDVLSNAPAGAWAQKATGSWCLDKITSVGGNSVARAWETQHLDPNSVYLNDDTNPVINSNNGRFSVTFFPGVI